MTLADRRVYKVSWAVQVCLYYRDRRGKNAEVGSAPVTTIVSRLRGQRMSGVLVTCFVFSLKPDRARHYLNMCQMCVKICVWY